MNRTRHLFSVTALLVCAASQGACAATGPDRQGDGRDANAEQSILGGSPAKAYPEAALIDMARGGVLVARCSGAVIAPRAVLTAGHCVAGFDGFRVTAPYAGGQTATGSSAVTYDYVGLGDQVDPAHHDVGLILLDAPIQLDAYPAIATAPLSPGDKVLNLGRVRNGEASTTGLFVSKPLPVDSAESRGFPFDYVARERIEHGDSGGPDIVPGTSPHRIVAVNSGAGAGLELLARVDLLAGWIQAQIAPHAHHGGSCDGAHDVCEQGDRLSRTCDPCVAKVCKQDPSCCKQSWDARCVQAVEQVCSRHCSAGSPDDGCEGVSYEGECRGDVAVYCDGGLQSLDCGARGMSCGWDPSQGLTTCL